MSVDGLRGRYAEAAFPDARSRTHTLRRSVDQTLSTMTDEMSEELREDLTTLAERWQATALVESSARLYVDSGLDSLFK